jgi:hypothetical protein
VRQAQPGETGPGEGQLYEVPWHDLTASTPEQDAAAADNTQIVAAGKRPIRVLPPEEQDRLPLEALPTPPAASPRPTPEPPAPAKVSGPLPAAPEAVPPKPERVSPFAPRRTPSAPKAVPVRRPPPMPEPEPEAPPEGRRLRVTFAGNVVLVDRIAPMASIGRSAANEVMADAPSVSRAHGKIMFRGDSFYLVDYSKNGTYLYDERGNEMLVHKCEFKLPFSGRMSLGRPKDDRQAKILLFRTEAGPVTSG